jgi:WD40 repeat protein
MIDTSVENADQAVRKLQYRPDGRVVAAWVGKDHAIADVFLWDLAREQIIERSSASGDVDESYAANEFREEYPTPAVSPDLEVIAWTSVQEPETGEQLRLLDTWSKPPQEVLAWSTTGQPLVQCLGFDPHGDAIYAASLSGPERTPMVFCWNVETLFNHLEHGGDAELDPLTLPDPRSTPTCLTFSPNGRVLAVGQDSGRIDFFDLSKPRSPPVVVFNSLPSRAVHGLTYSPDGLYLVTQAGWNLTVMHRDVKAASLDLSDHDAATDVAFHPNGRILALARQDGSVSFHDVATLQLVQQFQWGIGPLFSIAFAPDGLTCLAGGEQTRVVIWDVDG